MKKSIIAIVVLSVVSTGVSAATVSRDDLQDSRIATNAGNTTQLINRVDTVEKTATKAMDGVVQTQAILTNINNKNSAQDKAIIANTTGVAANGAAIATNTQNVSGLQSSVAALQTQTGSFVTKSVYDAGQAKQDSDLSNAVSKQATKDGQQDATDTKQLGMIVQNAKDVASKVDQQKFDDSQAAQDKILNTLGTAVNTNAGNIKTAQDTADTAIRGVSKVQGEINTLTTDVATNTKGISKVQGEVNIIQRDVGQNRTAIIKNRQDIDSNKAAIATKVDQSVYDAGQAAQDQRITTNANGVSANKAALATKVDQQVFKDDQDRQDKAIASKVETSVFTADQQRQDAVIASHDSRITSNTSAIKQNAAGVQHNSNRIANHETRIQKLEAVQGHGKAFDDLKSQVDKNEKAIKRVGAMSQAISGLHYNRNENGMAVAVGEYAGAAAVAGGAQFQTSENSAVTVGISYDGANVGGNVGWHTSW